MSTPKARTECADPEARSNVDHEYSHAWSADPVTHLAGRWSDDPVTHLAQVYGGRCSGGRVCDQGHKERRVDAEEDAREGHQVDQGVEQGQRQGHGHLRELPAHNGVWGLGSGSGSGSGPPP